MITIAPPIKRVKKKGKRRRQQPHASRLSPHPPRRVVPRGVADHLNSISSKQSSKFKLISINEVPERHVPRQFALVHQQQVLVNPSSFRIHTFRTHYP